MHFVDQEDFGSRNWSKASASQIGNSFAKFIFNDRFMVASAIISHSSSERQHEMIIKAGQLLQKSIRLEYWGKDLGPPHLSSG